MFAVLLLLLLLRGHCQCGHCDVLCCVPLWCWHAGLPYSAGLVVILDVRCLVPGSSTASPAGWSCLPVFEAAGPYVASGVYHLPLFQVSQCGFFKRTWVLQGSAPGSWHLKETSLVHGSSQSHTVLSSWRGHVVNYQWCS